MKIIYSNTLPHYPLPLPFNGGVGQFLSLCFAHTRHEGQIWKLKSNIKVTYVKEEDYNGMASLHN